MKIILRTPYDLSNKNYLRMKYLKKINLQTHSWSELGLWLLIPFASLTSHTALPIPPTMILFFIALALWIVQSVSRGNVFGIENQNPIIREGIIIFFIFCLYLFASQYFMSSAFRRYMGALMAPLYLVLILIFSKDVSGEFLKKIALKFIRYSIIILAIEAVVRYIVSIVLFIQGENSFVGIYMFKFNGPIYSSSNLVAAHLIFLLFFILWWKHRQGQFLKKEIWFVAVLLILTLSRASIVALAGGLIYYWFFRNLNWKKSLLLLCSGFVFLFLSLFALKFFIHDPSFQSKFAIANESIKYYQTADLTAILFGVGFYETEHLMAYYAHNYFLLFLMESGIFGFIGLCATLLYLIKSTNGSISIVLLPFLIQTAAESVTFIPYFYVGAALIILIPLKHDSKKNTLLLD